ncbi:hypothetical protein [Ancylomarina longa]|nr:hypothetical protein [Ancylomarina longa]
MNINKGLVPLLHNSSINLLQYVSKIKDMASIKRLKKDIDYLSFEVISDCYNYNYLHPGKNEKVLDIVRDTIIARNQLIARVNHPDGKDNHKLVKSYYKAIFTDLLKGVDNSFERLSNLVKEK